MRPQASVQVAQSAQYTVAKCLPASDKASLPPAQRNVVAWEIDQPSEIFLQPFELYVHPIWRP